MSEEPKPKASAWMVNWPRAIGVALACGFLLICLAHGPAVAVKFYVHLFLLWPLAAVRLLFRNPLPFTMGMVGLALAAATAHCVLGLWARRHGKAWPPRRTIALFGLPLVLAVAAVSVVVLVRFAVLIANFRHYEWLEGLKG